MSKRVIITILLIATLGVLGSFKTAQATYYQIDWDDSLTPTVSPGIQLSLIATPFYGFLFVGATNGRLYISPDGGDNWTETQPAGNVNKNWSALTASEDGQILVAAVSSGRVYISIDGGDNWTETQPDGNVDKNWSKVGITDGGESIIATVNGGRMYRSIDLGDTWQEVGSPLDTDLEWSALHISSTNRPALAAARNGRMYISSDGGENWAEIQPAGDMNHDWSTVTCDSGSLYCLSAIDGGRMYYSDSEGFEWEEVRPAGNTDQAWSAVAAAENLTYLATTSTGKLYYTTDEGGHWYESQVSSGGGLGYSAVVVSDDGSAVWTANQSEVIYKGEFSVAPPGQPSNFTHTANTASIKTFAGEPLFKMDELQNSGTGIFSFAHGNVQVGNKFYVGTRTNPAKIVVFNDPTDLSDYTAVNLPGLVGLENLTYDSVHHRIYGVGTSSFSAQSLKIYSFNPDNIASYTQVVNEATLTDEGSSAIITDGTYVYGVTYAIPPKFFKFRVSDWGLEATRTWTGGPASGHSVRMQEYSDRTELYFGASLGTTSIAKVNASDLSYVEHNFGTTLSFSDDIYFKYLDNTGGIIYAGRETMNTGYALDTRTMTPTQFTAPATYGYFSNGQDLYGTGLNGYIAKFIDFDLDSNRFYELPGEKPNEMFFASTGQKFFTNWSSPGYIKQFDETSILVTTTSVTLNWEADPVPETSYEIYISTDGIAYTLHGTTGLTSYTASQLVPGTAYWFRIIAKNGHLSSTPVVHNLTTSLFSPAAIPSISSVTLTARTTSSLTIGWEGSNAVSYIAKQGSSSSGWTNSTSYTFSGLTCGQDYQVKIKGKNSDGVQGEYEFYNFSTSSCSSGGGGGGSSSGNNNGSTSENSTPTTSDDTTSNSTSPSDTNSGPISSQRLCEEGVFIQAHPATNGDLNLRNRLKGKILLGVEDKGRLYYIHPETGQPYYVTDAQAQCLFEKASLGITNQNLNRIPEKNSTTQPGTLAQRLRGFLLLQVENKGQTWFVDDEGWRHPLHKNNLVSTMTQFALGIVNNDLKKIVSLYTQ